MKTLYLLRHAKSSWSNPGLRDFDRPLNGRGRKNATKIGEYMAGKGLKPDLVLSSSSARTRETVSCLEVGFGAEMDVRFLDDLYHSSSYTMLNLAQNAPDDVKSLMLVAHNPGMNDAALRFIETGKDGDISEIEYNFPTGALAQFEFDVIRWEDIDFGQGKLIRFIKPKTL